MAAGLIFAQVVEASEEMLGQIDKLDKATGGALDFILHGIDPDKRQEPYTTIPEPSENVVGYAGQLIAAILETAGLFAQSEVIAEMQGLIGSAGLLFYTVAAIGAILSVALFGNYRQGAYLFLGPGLFWMMIDGTVPAKGTVWHYGERTMGADPSKLLALSNFPGLEYDGSSSRSESGESYQPPTPQISWFFAMYENAISSAVHQIVSVLVDTKNREDLLFVARERLLARVVNSESSDRRYINLLAAGLMGECGRVIHLSGQSAKPRHQDVASSLREIRKQKYEKALEQKISLDPETHQYVEEIHNWQVRNFGGRPLLKYDWEVLEKECNPDEGTGDEPLDDEVIYTHVIGSGKIVIDENGVQTSGGISPDFGSIEGADPAPEWEKVPSALTCEEVWGYAANATRRLAIEHLSIRNDQRAEPEIPWCEVREHVLTYFEHKAVADSKYDLSQRVQVTAEYAQAASDFAGRSGGIDRARAQAASEVASRAALAVEAAAQGAFHAARVDDRELVGELYGVALSASQTLLSAKHAAEVSSSPQYPLNEYGDIDRGGFTLYYPLIMGEAANVTEIAAAATSQAAREGRSDVVKDAAIATLEAVRAAEALYDSFQYITEVSPDLDKEEIKSNLAAAKEKIEAAEKAAIEAAEHVLLDPDELIADKVPEDFELPATGHQVIEIVATFILKNTIANSVYGQLSRSVESRGGWNPAVFEGAFGRKAYAEKEAWRGQLVFFAGSIPYFQGVLLFILSMVFPFFALFLLHPGYIKSFFVWMGLWAWVKSWDIGFAVVFFVRDLLWEMFQGPYTFGGSAGSPENYLSGLDWDSPASVFHLLAQNNPTANLNTYYYIVALLTCGVPFMTAHLCLGATDLFAAFRMGIEDPAAKHGQRIGRETTRYESSATSRYLQDAMMLHQLAAAAHSAGNPGNNLLGESRWLMSDSTRSRQMHIATNIAFAQHFMSEEGLQTRSHLAALSGRKMSFSAFMANGVVNSFVALSQERNRGAVSGMGGASGLMHLPWADTRGNSDSGGLGMLAGGVFGEREPVGYDPLWSNSSGE